MNDDRNLTIVARYQTGETLRQIGRSVDLSAERVRQLLEKHEKEHHVVIERHTRGTKQKSPRVTWCCEICRKTKEVTQSQLSRLSSRCELCQHMDIVAINQWIATFRAAPNKRGVLHRIALAAGYKVTAAHTVKRRLYCYLLATKQIDVIREIWPDGVPNWLAKIYAGVGR